MSTVCETVKCGARKCYGDKKDDFRADKASRGPNGKAYRWRPGEGLAYGQVPISLGFYASPSLGHIYLKKTKVRTGQAKTPSPERRK